MNVLMLSLDKTLLASGEFNNAQKRHILYGSHTSNLFIVVHVLRRKYPEKNRLSDNVLVYPVNGFTKLFSFINMYRLGRKICRENSVDLITTQDPFITGLIGYLLKKRFAIPLNIQMHSDFFDNKYWLAEKPCRFLLNILGKILMHGSDTIRVGAFGGITKKIIESYKINADKVYSIPIFIGLERFINCQDNSLREKLISRGFNKVVLSAGRLISLKDIATFINSAKIVLSKHPKALFLIAGDGPQRNKLIVLAGKLGISDNVIFAGEVTSEEMPKYFRACDVFVLTSLYEGYPRTLIEAAISRKPIVSTNICSARDIVIDAETGFIVRQKDTKTVADRITRLLDNPGLAVQMGGSGFEHIKAAFNEEKIISDLTNMWRETANLIKDNDDSVGFSC